MGFRAGLHNHMGQIVQTPEEVDRCMAMTDPKLFSFSPDTAHLYLAGCDVVKTLEKHKSRLMLAGLQRRERMASDKPMLRPNIFDLGDGEIDFPGCHRVLKSIGFKGWLIRRSRYRAPGPARQLRALRRIRRGQAGVRSMSEVHAAHAAGRRGGQRPGRRTTRIIDPHVHVWKHDPEFPFAEGAHVPERDATPETLLDLMKANGVSQHRDHPGDPLQVRQPLSGERAEALSRHVSRRLPRGSAGPGGARSPFAAHGAGLSRRASQSRGQRVAATGFAAR